MNSNSRPRPCRKIWGPNLEIGSLSRCNCTSCALHGLRLYLNRTNPSEKFNVPPDNLLVLEHQTSLEIASCFHRTHLHATCEIKGHVPSAHKQNIQHTRCDPNSTLGTPKSIASKQALLLQVHHTHKQAEFNHFSPRVWTSVISSAWR